MSQVVKSRSRKAVAQKPLPAEEPVFFPVARTRNIAEERRQALLIFDQSGQDFDMAADRCKRFLPDYFNHNQRKEFVLQAVAERQ